MTEIFEKKQNKKKWKTIKKKNIKQFRISNKNFHIVYNDSIRIDKLRIRYDICLRDHKF